MTNGNAPMRAQIGFARGGRGFSVYSCDDRRIRLQGLGGSVEVDGTPVSLSDGFPAGSSGSLGDGSESLRARYVFPERGLAWEWELSCAGGAAEVVCRLENTGKSPLALREWNVIRASDPAGGAVRLGGEPGDVRFFRWQPWDMRVERLSPRSEHESANFLHLCDPASGVTLLCGFLTLDRMDGCHRVRTSDDCGIAEYRAACSFGEFTLAPGSVLSSEILSVSFHADPYRALEFWAERVRSVYRPSLAQLPPVSWVGGWTDPFSERERCWEQYALENARVLREKLKGFSVGYVWTSQCNLKDSIPGNWTNVDRRQIPGGLERFFGQLGAMGYKPGLWVAPFWFYAEAEGMLDRCRDFVLKDENGDPVCEEDSWGYDYGDNLPCYRMHKYYLDGSHPGARAFVGELFGYYRRIGVRYYMLDFLDIAEKGRLRDRSMTPLQAARAMLSAIRDAAGPDTHIQTAVASTPGYVGLIDAARVGRDFGEGRPLQGGPLSDWRNATHVLHDAHYSSTRYFLQNAAAGYFTHGKLYMNDFNLLTVDKPMPLEHARIAVTVFGLGGGSPVMLGDDYTRIDDERLRMVKLCLPRTERSFRPLDLFEHAHPDEYCRILTLDVGRPWDRYVLAAVFNMDPRAYGFRLDFGRLGLGPRSRCRVYEFWTEEYCGTFEGSFSGAVPPHSCRLYRIAEARRHPWLLSTDMHVQQGAAEVERLEWDERAMRLSGTACRPSGEKGNLFFLMPRKFRLINHEGAGLLKELLDMNVIIRMPVDFDRECIDFELFFEPWVLPHIAPKPLLGFSTESEWLDRVAKNKAADDARVVE